MAEQTASATRPAGTSALIYAVLALVAGALGVLMGVVYPLTAIAGFAVLAAAVTALPMMLQTARAAVDSVDPLLLDAALRPVLMCGYSPPGRSVLSLPPCSPRSSLRSSDDSPGHVSTTLRRVPGSGFGLSFFHRSCAAAA